MEKGTLKKWLKKKDHNSGPGYNPKVVSARPPPPNAEIKWYDQNWGINLQQCIIINPLHAAVGSLNLIAPPRRSRRQSEWAKDHAVRGIDLRGTVEVAKHSGPTLMT